jgi:hypothetical protein
MWGRTPSSVRPSEARLGFADSASSPFSGSLPFGNPHPSPPGPLESSAKREIEKKSHGCNHLRAKYWIQRTYDTMVLGYFPFWESKRFAWS